MIACVCRIRVSVSHRKLLRHHLKSDSSIACATSCRKLRHRYTEKLIAPFTSPSRMVRLTPRRMVWPLSATLASKSFTSRITSPAYIGNVSNLCVLHLLLHRNMLR